MKPAQFRILYGQFLFRMVDIELLSVDAQGDASRLLGQFAALLVAVSIPLSVIGAGMGHASLVLQWSGVHLMIATTMVVVGLFAVLTWDSTFPDRRDVMVLATLPIRPRAIFFAKVAAVATALSLTVATLHIFAGFIWPLSLNNRHQASIAPSIAYDGAMVPLGPQGLERVLRQDLLSALRAGALADARTGATVGVWKRGDKRIFAYGAAKPDSIFEIGSITKTFTGLALALLVTDGKTRLNEPVRNLLPPQTVGEPEGREITLLDLATHRSGLPSFPDDLHPTDGRNPLTFPEYGKHRLYEFMKRRGVAKPSHVSFAYSNLGFGLLGEALANQTGTSYADLVSGITQSLGMHDTVIQLSPEQRERLIQGYDSGHLVVVPVDLGALAAAGAIRSTAADMLLYLTTNLHPGTARLRNALEVQHKLRAPVAPGIKTGLGWIYDASKGIYEHSGGTAGYTSYAFFSPQGDYAVVVLTNIGPDLFQFTSLLGEHIRARLVGERAISLNTIIVPASGGGLWALLRLLGAWWGTMMAAGAFIYCCVLGTQGLVARLLPRRHFLRISSWMQLAAFSIFVAGYFLEPKLVTPSALVLPQSSAYLEWSPSYWFLGLFQQLNGSPALPELARRAWVAIAASFGATALAYTMAYLRTMQKIVEEPDIAPASSGVRWLPRFGNEFTTAVGQFTVRTMLRSRQHRLLLAFYLGIGFAFTIYFQKANSLATPVKVPVLVSTILFLMLCVVGMRVVFSLPTDMRANWIFRITAVPTGSACIVARRRALYALSVGPISLSTGVVLFSMWPWQTAAKHLAVLVLLGCILGELCLHGRQKLPFTCSYLPGKSNFNITFLLCSLLIFGVLVNAAQLERDSFENARGYTAILSVLAAFAVCMRWSATSQANSPEGELRFEEAAKPEVFALNLHRDGITDVAAVESDA